MTDRQEARGDTGDLQECVVCGNPISRGGATTDGGEPAHGLCTIPPETASDLKKAIDIDAVLGVLGADTERDDDE